MIRGWVSRLSIVNTKHINYEKATNKWIIREVWKYSDYYWVLFFEKYIQEDNGDFHHHYRKVLCDDMYGIEEYLSVINE
jgi:hypothetical protein